jgi:hypothetical protein
MFEQEGTQIGRKMVGRKMKTEGRKNSVWDCSEKTDNEIGSLG